MASTTIKLSVETRERLRALGGDTYEDTVIEALDALEANRFWAAAEAAAAWQERLPDDERRRRHDGDRRDRPGVRRHRVIEAGDIHLADVNQEQQLPVLVVSNSRFTRLSGRVIVAPAVPGQPDEVPFPWRIAAEDHVFAIDLLRSIPADRLLERVGRVTPSVAASVQRVTRHIL